MEGKIDFTEIARKAMFLGLGVASATKDKAEQLIQELVQKGEVSQSEAREFVNQMVEKGKEEQEEFRAMFKVEADKWLAEMPVVSRKDYEELLGRLATIEARLREQEAE